jgi:stage II sporulation protein D
MARIHYSNRRNSSRAFLPTAYCLLPAILLLGCGTTLDRNIASRNPPIVRVRLLGALDKLTLVASEKPVFRTESDPTPRLLDVAKNAPIIFSLGPGGWRVGGVVLGTGILTIQPAGEGTVGIAPVLANGAQPTPRLYRGHYRLVPVGPTKFDVVNEVDVDGYLAGVLPRELYKNWHDQTYEAQAIVARTYVLYEKAVAPAERHWDVLPDERSQVYGGMVDETDKSRRAVNETQGIVVTSAPEGEDPRIFEAYFSSCCGGVSQSAADAFGKPFLEVLQEQNNHAICNAAPRFTWGPVVIGKQELTRRFRAWGNYKKRPEKDMTTITEVVVQAGNVFGRPTRFLVTDSRKLGYSLLAEEFRSACNWDANNAFYAPKDKSPAPILYSSFVRVLTDVDSIRFVEGHGNGHGVGLCQWCSERRAEEGMAHEDIVLAAYPHAKLVRAY